MAEAVQRIVHPPRSALFERQDSPLYAGDESVYSSLVHRLQSMSLVEVIQHDPASLDVLRSSHVGSVFNPRRLLTMGMPPLGHVPDEHDTGVGQNQGGATTSFVPDSGGAATTSRVEGSAQQSFQGNTGQHGASAQPNMQDDGLTARTARTIVPR